MRFFALFFVLLSFSGFAQKPDTLKWLNTFLNDEVVQQSPMSICALDVETGEVVMDVAANVSLPPASTLKLLTTATALKVLGSDYRFKTQIHYNGSIKDSILSGNLIIKGEGDPTLGSKYMFGNDRYDFYKHWTLAIKELGIKSIEGDLLIDRSFYADNDVPQTWIWEDLGNYFGAAAQSISLYDNTFAIVFETDNNNGGKTRVVGTEPYIPDLSLENKVLASNDPRDRAYVFGSTFDTQRIIKGTLPKGKDEFKIKASIPNPGLLLGFEFQKALLYEGISLTGKIAETLEYTIDSTIITWESPSLAEIIQPLNYESINLFAEHLCKQIGWTLRGEGTTNAGCKAIKNYWKNHGLTTDFLFLADGSGLSRANGISSHFLTQVLFEMYNDEINSEAYINSIPVTGLQGTQKYYFQQSFLKGKAQAKSGSMTRVRSFAGYMTTQNGKKLAFAIIVNNFNCGSFKMAGKMEKLMENMYLNL